MVSGHMNGKPFLNKKFLSKLGFRKNAKIEMLSCSITNDIPNGHTDMCRGYIGKIIDPLEITTTIELDLVIRS